MKETLKILLVFFISLFVIIANLFITQSFAASDIDIKPSDGEDAFTVNDGKLQIKQFIKDVKDKEVTVELDVKNNDTDPRYNEVVFVVDGSTSNYYTSEDGDIYYDRDLNIVKDMSSKILASNPNAKIAVVGSYGATYQFNYDKEMNCDDYYGDEEYHDVEVVDEYDTPVEKKPIVYSEFSNSIDEINKNVEKMRNVPQELDVSYLTKVLSNIQGGLKKAESMFSKNALTKNIILLTDGMPTEDSSGNYVGFAEYPYFNEYISDEWETQNITNGSNKIVYTNTEEGYEKAASLLQTICKNTRNEINTLNNNNINVNTILNGFETDEIVYYGEQETAINVQQVDEFAVSYGLFADNVYKNFNNGSLKNIYEIKKLSNAKSVETEIIDSLKFEETVPDNTLNIVDNIDEKLLENYSLKEIKNISTGKSSINENETAINWNIDKLINDKLESLEFVLVLNDNFNKDISNTPLKISKNITINYNSESLDDLNPKSSLTISIPNNTKDEELNEVNATNEINTENIVTESKNKGLINLIKTNNPKTGDNIMKYISIGVVAIIILLIIRKTRYGMKRRNIIK